MARCRTCSAPINSLSAFFRCVGVPETNSSGTRSSAGVPGGRPIRSMFGCNSAMVAWFSLSRVRIRLALYDPVGDMANSLNLYFDRVAVVQKHGWFPADPYAFWRAGCDDVAGAERFLAVGVLAECPALAVHFKFAGAEVVETGIARESGPGDFGSDALKLL